MRLTTLASIVLGASLLAAPSFAQQTKRRRYEMLANAGATMDVTSRGCSVSGVPAHVRNVPKHPDDNYGGWAAPIPDKELGCPYAHLDIKSELGMRRNSGRREIAIGGKIGWHLWSEANTGETARRNYTNAIGSDQRGEGAALTFYGPINRHAGLDDLYWGGFLQYSRGDAQQGRFFARADVDVKKLNILNGWDRYNHLERYKTYSLGRMVEPSFSAGYEWRENALTTRAYGLVAFGSLKPTALGEQTTINLRPMVGGGITFLVGK